MAEEQQNGKRMHLDGFSFGMRGIKGDSCLDSSLQFNPGVGSYEVDKGFNALTKKASQMKFQGSERFKSNKMITPGPGSYNPKHLHYKSSDQLPNKNKRSFAESHKTHGSIFENHTTSNNLGPGYYYFSQMNDTFFNSTQNSLLNSKRLTKDKQKLSEKSLNLSFSHKIRGLEFSKYSKRSGQLTNYKLLDSPPIGSYNIETTRSQDSFAFPKGKRLTLDSIVSKSPGPGNYNLPTQLFSKSQSNIGLSQFSNQKRFFNQSSTEDKTPGPGYYLVDEVKDPKYQKTSVYSFGKQKRNTLSKSFNPPPGHYTTYTEPPKHATIIGKSKRPPVGNDVPGIGSYNIASNLQKENNIQKNQETLHKDISNDENSQHNMKGSKQVQIDYKERLLQQKKILLQQSPHFGKNIQRVLNDNIPLYRLKQLDSPSPTYYDKILHVTKKEPIQFAKANRREEYLDVYNIKLLDERSPGPAKYMPALPKQNQGVYQPQQKKGDLFRILNHPGVGWYDIDESSFARYAKQQQSQFSTKNIYKKNIKLPSLSKSGLIKGYVY